VHVPLPIFFSDHFGIFPTILEFSDHVGIFPAIQKFFQPFPIFPTLHAGKNPVLLTDGIPAYLMQMGGNRNIPLTTEGIIRRM
jgi:hypothetical protein